MVVAASDSCQRPLSFRGCSSCLRPLVVAVETHLCVLALLSVKEGHLFGPELIGCVETPVAQKLNPQPLFAVDKSLFVAASLLAF